MSSVTVCGVAFASVTPDRAEISLSLTHLAADAASALDEVAARSQQLETMLAGHGFARSDWATEGVQVGEEYQWKNETNVLIGYRATTAVSVTVRSTDVVGTVIRDGVTDVGASVRSMVWRVDAANPARRTLLAEAARDARVRATEYVEALALRLGEVELISELPIAPGPQPQLIETMAFSKSGADASELSVNGGLVELSAAVYVRFAILR